MAELNRDAPCHLCGLGPVVAFDRDDNPLPSTRLWCTACGEQWDATPEERAERERDDALWREELAREYAEVSRG